MALIQYYLLTPINSPAETYITVSMKIDSGIKLIPGFLIPYFSLYILLIFILISIIRKKSAHELTIFLMAVLFLWSIINFAHGFFPTQNTIRPAISESGLFFELVKDLYTSVKPFRTLPSWHTATAVLCMFAFYKMNFRRPLAVLFWGILICLSPVFLKMAYIVDVLIAIPLGYLSYALAERISVPTQRTERIQEIVKAFTLESLVQSVAIGFRDENTISSLVEGLTRVENSLTEEDKEEIKKIGSGLHTPVESLKEVINNLIISIDPKRHIEKAKEMFAAEDKDYSLKERDLKQAAETLINEACVPFDDAKFRFALLEIKKKNTQLINTNSIELAAMERSEDIIFRFKSFLESHRKDIPVIKKIAENPNGHVKLTFDEIKIFSKELRKPPYETTVDEIWNAFFRLHGSKVKELGDQKNPANIISLTQYALGKIDTLEPYIDKVETNFNDWIHDNKIKGREFTAEEMEWLTMMKNYFSSFLEINMTSFNQPPFVNKGGASKAYNIFGHDLNRILYELNEKLS
jgi:membrane-associated phospholipid phosphatase